MKARTTKRTRAVIYDYLVERLSRDQLAKKYELKRGTIDALLSRNSITLPPAERVRRQVNARRKASYANVGRKPVWGECPPDLRDDYDTMRRYMPSAEARARLEGQV